VEVLTADVLATCRFICPLHIFFRGLRSLHRSRVLRGSEPRSSSQNMMNGPSMASSIRATLGWAPAAGRQRAASFHSAGISRSRLRESMRRYSGVRSR